MEQLALQIDELKRCIREVGDMVEQAISRAISALVRYDRMLANAVVAADKQIDMKEIEVEERCVDILATCHPTGQDLRFVIATLKINYDLERIGDLAANIAKTVVKLVDCERFQRVGGCDTMAHKAQMMVYSSLQALVNSDAQLARDVIASDDEVDEMQRAIQVRIEQAIDRLPENVRAMMQLDFVVRQLERVGDMATNIAEEVIYLVEGKIVRHPSIRREKGRERPGRRI